MPYHRVYHHVKNGGGQRVALCNSPFPLELRSVVSPCPCSHRRLFPVRLQESPYPLSYSITLNKYLEEPSELVFFAGGIYECTINNSNGSYNQSQLTFMLDIPSQDTVDRFYYIPLWIAPAGTQIIDIHQQNLPMRHQLITLGWNEVSIGCSPERLVLARGALQAKMIKYSIKRIGEITINKSQGETLPLGLAVKITHQYSPFGKRSNSSIIKSYNNSKNDSDCWRKTICYSKDVGIDHYGQSMDSILKSYP